MKKIFLLSILTIGFSISSYGQSNSKDQKKIKGTWIIEKVNFDNLTITKDDDPEKSVQLLFDYQKKLDPTWKEKEPTLGTLLLYGLVLKKYTFDGNDKYSIFDITFGVAGDTKIYTLNEGVLTLEDKYGDSKYNYEFENDYLILINNKYEIKEKIYLKKSN